jgi:5-hydroxyisourate hydrolase / 2-oxo-4-hydroxy-4-carboxy-5-ureidoimidazoline decarboxylase
MPTVDAARELQSCCGARAWVNGMLARRPFGSRDALLATAHDVFRTLGESDWLEAFAHHPRLGERRTQAATTEQSRTWSAMEQSRVSDSDNAVRDSLADANIEYEARFGYIPIVCAMGLSAEEILAVTQARIANAPDDELRIAAGEQEKITRLRLERLVESNEESGKPRMATISTHVLDTSLGRPAEGVPVVLQQVDGGATLGSGNTDSDGRVKDLAGGPLAPGVYRLEFDTAAYFAATSRASFYPEVSVVFRVVDGSHHHVPLLLSPFGYSTYRGS